MQRTRAQNVAPVYERFLARFPEIEDLKTVTLSEIEELIYPLGLKWRAPLLKKLCEYLAQAGGQVPLEYSHLLTLPAVGPYVAAAMVSFHGNRRAVIIDANIVRWLCRMVGKKMHGEARREKWLIALADTVTPARNVRQFNYSLLDFTMSVCAKKPKCPECPLRELCVFGRTASEIKA